MALPLSQIRESQHLHKDRWLQAQSALREGDHVSVTVWPNQSVTGSVVHCLPEFFVIREERDDMPFHDGAFIHIPIARLLHLTLSCAERWFAFPDLYSWIPAAIIGDEIAPFETSPCTIPQRRATIPCEEATVHGTRDALEIAVALGFRARGWPAYYGENDWICNALNSRYLEGRSIPLEDAALPVVSFSSGYEAERISTFLRSRCGEEVFDLIRKASTDEFGRQVGYPDIVLAGDSFILCEVKRKNEKLRDSQAGAIANLLSSGVRVEIIRCSFVNGPGT